MTDPRVLELLQLAREEGLPLVVRPETVCALEDDGWLVDPFTGRLWRNPSVPVVLFAVPRDVQISAFKATDGQK